MLETNNENEDHETPDEELEPFLWFEKVFNDKLFSIALTLTLLSF